MLHSHLLQFANSPVEFVCKPPFQPDRYFKVWRGRASEPIIARVLFADNKLDVDVIGRFKASLIVPKIFRNEVAPLDYIRQHVAFLVSFVCDGWEYIHAGCVAVQDQGWLFIGDSGAGKSTLCRMMPRATIVEDDSLWLNQGKAYWLARSGFAQADTGDDKFVQLLTDSVEGVQITKVFLLDKEYEGGSYKHLGTKEIPRSHTLPTSMPETYRNMYLEEPPILLKAHSFIVGTNGNLEKTILRVQRLGQSPIL
jgi:hypothetical protein